MNFHSSMYCVPTGHGRSWLSITFHPWTVLSNIFFIRSNFHYYKIITDECFIQSTYSLFCIQHCHALFFFTRFISFVLEYLAMSQNVERIGFIFFPQGDDRVTVYRLEFQLSPSRGRPIASHIDAIFFSVLFYKVLLEHLLRNSSSNAFGEIFAFNASFKSNVISFTRGLLDFALKWRLHMWIFWHIVSRDNSGEFLSRQ